MGYAFTSIDGCRVEVNVAAAFYRMAAAFQRDTGCTLHVRDGSRTREEQQAEWNRYQNYGPPVAAYPGTSNHEIDGPNGPRSIDIYDSGDDPGVTSRGSARDGWMARNAGSFGFENEGYNFGEAWHKTFRGAIGGSGPAPEPAPNLSEEDYMIRIQSPNRGIALIGTGYYRHLTSDEEVINSEPLISKHLNGNDRQFDLWVSMAVGGQGATPKA